MDDIDELIKASKKGDKAALDELLKRYRAKLIEFIRKELGSHLRKRAESEDIAQQVCLSVLKEIENYEKQKDGSFFGWLRVIALNRIRDLHRREFKAKKRKGEIRTADIISPDSGLKLFEKISSPGTSPSMAANKQDLLKLLDEAIKKLPPMQEKAIRLRYFSLLSVKETAEKLGKTEASVRSLCVRAILKLKELLKDVI